MSVLTFVIWTGAIIFACICLLVVLDMMGSRYVQVPERYQKPVALALAVSVITTGGTAFKLVPELYGQRKPTVLPVTGLLLTEQGETKSVLDGEKQLYVATPNVVLCYHSPNTPMDGPCEDRLAEVRLSFDPDLIDSKPMILHHRKQEQITVDDRQYLLSFTYIGKLEQDLQQQHAEKKDFILLNIQKTFK